MRRTIGLLVLLAGCAPVPVEDQTASDQAANTAGAPCQVHVASPRCGTPASMDADGKRRAEQLTSIFENSTTELQYAYIEALGDGRGYTAGRAGFTTGTGDLLVVAERYTALVPDNALAPLLPRLRQLAQAESASITGLSALPAAWRETAADPLQRQVQDEVVDEMYYAPAMAAAGCAGATLPLSLAFLYDTDIQHGDGDDADSMGSLLERARRAAGGTPKSGVDERVWLRALMTARRADLRRACDADTRQAWAGSVSRVDTFLGLLDADRVELDGPLALTVDGDHYEIP